jgi:N-acetylglucosaminyldiphosphoundecaprenol N-acetyl-beta-D-mannosaminyltransferase
MIKHQEQATQCTEKRTELETIQILGVRIHSLSICQLLYIIGQYITHQKKAIIANVNVHGMNLAYKFDWYRDFLNHADIVFCDGYGVILGARILGHRIQERITFADCMWPLAEHAEKNRYTLFFLGGHPGVAEKAASRLQARFPHLLISGIQHGYFDKAEDSSENESIIQRINSTKPNILIVGFGMPLQEQWLIENWDRIEANVALTAGAVFDYISGELRRGPKWMTNHGLEWLARLWIEPGRLWKRYLIGNPVFLWRIFLQRVGIYKLGK